MKQEIGGWRLQVTRDLQTLMDQHSSPGSLLPLPASLGSARSSGDNWDMVSLESSDLDDCSEVSELFPLLEKGATTSLLLLATATSASNTSASNTSSTSTSSTSGSSSSGTNTNTNTDCGPPKSRVGANLSGSTSSSSTSNSSNSTSSSTPSPRLLGPPHVGLLATSMSGGRKIASSSNSVTFKIPSHTQTQTHQHKAGGGRYSPVNFPLSQGQYNNRSSPLPSSSSYSPSSSNKPVSVSVGQFAAGGVGSGPSSLQKQQPLHLVTAPCSSPSMSSSPSSPSPLRPHIACPRTHPSSPSPSLYVAPSSPALASPLPFPSRCCEPLQQQLSSGHANLEKEKEKEKEKEEDVHRDRERNIERNEEEDIAKEKEKDREREDGVSIWRLPVPELHSPAVSVASSSLSPCALLLPCPSSAGSTTSISTSTFADSCFLRRHGEDTHTHTHTHIYCSHYLHFYILILHVCVV
jgi:hypothetical protein